MSAAKRELIIQEADRLAARGKLDAAIKEYKRAVDLAPQDTNALNRLGDLLVRVTRIPEAIEVYQRIAEHFAQDGFFLKAIAIFKKVNRLDPRRTETYERLADLYFKQGLVVEGRQHLLTLADWFLRSNQPQEAVRVYRRLVELEPSNFQARAKLVDLSVQLGDAGAVGQEIDALGRSLLGRGMLDEAVKLYHRALDLSPEDGDFVAPCLDALVSAGRHAQATELAKKALTAAKSGIELKRAAAGVSFASGDVETARKLLEEVLPVTGGRADIAQLYGEVMAQAGEEVDAKELLLPAADRLLRAGDLNRAGDLMERLLKKHPDDAEVLELGLRVFDEKNDAPMVMNIETALADAYLREGRRDDAAQLYQRLARKDPENELFVRRLADLGVELRPVAAVPETEAAPEVTAPSPAAGEEVEFVEVDLPGTSETALPSEAPPAAVVEPQIAGVNIEELFTEAQVFAKYGLTDKASAHLERLLSVDPAHAGARRLLESLGGGVMGVDLGQTVAGSAPIPMPPPQAQEPSTMSEADHAREALAAFAAADSPSAASERPPSADLSLPVPGIDLTALSAKPRSPQTEAPLPTFDTVAMSHAEVAESARPADVKRTATGPIRLENLEAMLGLQPRPAVVTTASARRAEPPEPQLAISAQPFPEPAAEPEDGPSSTSAPAPPGPVEEPLELVEVSGVLAGPGDDQLRELDFLIQQGLLEDAGRLLERLREAFPEHPDVTTRHALLKARGWDEERRVPQEGASAAALFTEEEQFFDLAAELEKELAEEEMVAEATGAGKSTDVSIEELFKEFQRGVAEQVQEEDYDTHFNLGLAYREMGLLDEAIGEFQLSVKAPEFLVESASMIGACFLDKGLPDQSIEWYGRALTAPGLPMEMELGLRYELGRAHEAAGNTAAALASFSEVLAINPAFRDVMARVSKLRSN
jgi:tetratricopeptide (TPR) repeat protein